MNEIGDGWQAGSTYEEFMGRWSRRVAPKFVSWLEIPDDARWLDVGCGTGALTEAICDFARPAGVVACDPSASFIEYAQQHSNDERTSFVVAGVGALPRCNGGFDSVTSMLALNFFPAPEAAVKEMASVAVPGGAISACVWDYAGKMEFLRLFWDAVVEMDTDARELDEGVRFPICRPGALEELFRSAGLEDVITNAIEVPTQFATFNDYWSPLLGGTGPAAAYASSLGPDQRAVLARRLEDRLPQDGAGMIHLTARAWAVRGRV
jgi:SAM-dependent methyltransferase